MRNTKSYDVIIVGAGPAGLNTAYGLAESGHKVLLLEAKDEVGKDVVCAGVVGTELFAKFNLSRESIIREIYFAEVKSPFGTTVRYSDEKPFACVIDRKIFDRELLKRALSFGAEIFLKTSVNHIEISNDNVTVFADTEQEKLVFYSKVLVLATGIKTDLSRRIGLGYPVRFLKAIQEEIEISTTPPLTIFVGNEISDSAFAWAIPTDDRFMRVGLMAEDECSKRFNKFTGKYFSNIKFAKSKMKPIAQGLVNRTFRNRALVVGEAAGQVKTTTGGGIYWGMLCSELAVNVLESAFKRGDFSSEKLSEYEKRWQKLIGDEIKTGLKLRKLCGYLSDEQIEQIIQLAKTDGMIDFIRRNALFDWHGNALLNLLKTNSLRKIIEL